MDKAQAEQLRAGLVGTQELDEKNEEAIAELDAFLANKGEQGC